MPDLRVISGIGRRFYFLAGQGLGNLLSQYWKQQLLVLVGKSGGRDWQMDLLR